jgi:hypothetical protein
MVPSVWLFTEETFYHLSAGPSHLVIIVIVIDNCGVEWNKKRVKKVSFLSR